MKYKKIFDEVSLLIKNDNYLRSLFVKNYNRYYESVVIFENNFLKYKNEIKILDFGCGNPFHIFIFSKLGYNIIGYEPFQNEKNLKCIDLLSVNDKIVTEIPKSKFDVINMIDVIEHIPIMSNFFTEILSLSNSATKLFISTPNVMRIEMWILFLLRKQGHPQSLSTFLKSKDTFTNHQREFTMQELINTCSFFGFKNVIYKNCINTLPSHDILMSYHKSQGKQTFKRSRLSFLYSFLKFIFPKKFNNNLFLIVDGNL